MSIPLSIHLTKAREQLALAEAAHDAGDDARAAQHLENVLTIADYVQLDGSPGLAAARADTRDAVVRQLTGQP